MAVVTKTIGTSSRDYSTITLWEADLDSATYYTAGDEAVGEMYDDSDFNEGVTINGGGTIGLTKVTLTVASGNYHDGTAGTGVRLIRTGNTTGTWVSLSSGATRPIYVSWLELDANGYYVGNAFDNTGTAGSKSVLSRLVYHDKYGATANNGALYFSDNRQTYQLNCVVYDITNTAGAAQASRGIYCSHQQTNVAYNCTVYNIIRDGGTGVAECYTQGADDADVAIRNCIGCDVSGTSSGAKSCFPTSVVNTVLNYCLSSDTSASGTGSLTSKTAANQFVSTTNGSEDLHLKAGADAINAGVDLGTTEGVNYDIDYRDRDALGDTWDMGADEYVAAAGARPFPQRVFAGPRVGPFRGPF